MGKGAKMGHYKSNVRDLEFNLYEVLDLEKVLATGGLYVGGGIAPKLLRKLQDGTFMKAFTDKGRMSDLLVQTPVRVILESRAALMGAAAYAEARATELSGHSERAASV